MNENAKGGVGFLGLLVIGLILLKLTGHISIAWLTIFLIWISPILILAAIAAVWALIVTVLAIVAHFKE